MPHRRAGTLAWRLTALYVVLASVVLLSAVAALYSELIRDLDREDDALMREHALLLDALLLQPQQDAAAALLELEREREALGARRVHVRIVDAAGGTLLATPRAATTFAADVFPAAIEARDEQLRGVDIVADGVQYRVAAIQLSATAVGGQEAILQIAVDRAPVLSLLARYRMLLVGVTIPGVLLTGVIGYLMARRATEPLRQLADRIGSIHAENLDASVSLEGVAAELYPVVDAFNRLLDRLRGSFDRLRHYSAHLAHELRTPIHAIGVEIDTSIQDGVGDPTEVLRSVRSEIERLSGIVDGMLFLAYADRPGARIREAPCDLGQLATSAVDFYRPMAEDAGIQLSLTTSGPAPATVDKDLARRALGNLLGNALAFTPAGGRIDVTTTVTASWTEITVSDTGVGIAPERMPHILESAFQAHEPQIRDGSRVGLGLGLKIVDSIMKLHDGTLELRSDVGKGCTARLRFPREPRTKPS